MLNKKTVSLKILLRSFRTYRLAWIQALAMSSLQRMRLMGIRHLLPA